MYRSKELADNGAIRSTKILNPRGLVGLVGLQASLSLGKVPLLFELIDHMNHVLDNESCAHISPDINTKVSLILTLDGQTLIHGEDVGEVGFTSSVHSGSAKLQVKGVAVKEIVHALDPGCGLADVTRVPVDDAVVPLTGLVKSELQVASLSYNKVGTRVAWASGVGEDSTGVGRVVYSHHSW